MKNMALKDFVYPLIKAMDNYNYLLKSHHRRTAILSYEIGKAMRLSEKQLADVVIAAAIHDIGALSIQDKERLLEEDVSDPKPHCEMGYEMLRACNAFDDIANIVRYHHIFYYEEYMFGSDVSILSNIIHVADRIEIFLKKGVSFLEQRDFIRSEVRDRSGSIFHPMVCGAFLDASAFSEFWFSLNQSMEQLFSKIDSRLNIPLTEELVKGFSQIMARVVDYQCDYTSAHSFTVGNVAQHIGSLLNKDEEFKTQLFVAGLLHDIGKLVINPMIVTKKDALTNEEYKEIRKVPEYSSVILKDLTTSPWFNDIISWISETKPTTNKDEEKHRLGTEIIKLSHVITALMEDRPYRESRDIDLSIEIMESEVKNSLDKDLLSFVKEHKQEINKVINTFQKQEKDYFNNIEREFDYY